MNRVALIGLVRIDLPAATIRLCDGGFIEFGGETYASKDPVFGTIGSIDALTDGIGEEIPALELMLLPPEGSAPGDLSQPGFQQSIVRFWVGEYDQETGLLIGTPDLIFHGQIDMTTLLVGRTSRELSMTIVSTAERMFMRNEGNSLSPRWHKSIWPGELGHDNAIGLTIPVAWGVEKRPVSSSSGFAMPTNFAGIANAWGAYQ